MHLSSAINLALESDSSKPLKEAAQQLRDFMEDDPQLLQEAAAALIVMMMQPGLNAHREAWADDQDTDMFEVIASLCRK